jgi:bifunctional polynucleotide phosphatase/kinase
MHWEKDTSEGLLYYCQPSTAKRFNSDKIAAFDLDHTIIKPESGKKFSISVNDWIFAYKMDKLKEYSKKGYKIVIISNQKGSFEGKGNMTFEEFKTRWFSILDNLNVPAYILASVQDDFNRKPSPRMWKFMEKNLNGDLKINKKDSFYVGDAAGRLKDHSDCDIKFAINVGVPFMTPEEFFEDSNQYPFEELKHHLKGFNPKLYLEDQEKIHKINHDSWKELENEFKNNKFRVIILVGSPASGKSSLSHQLVNITKNKWHIHNMDIEKTKKKMKDKITKVLQETDEGVIIDATNGTIAAREEWINLVKTIDSSIEIWCIHINVSKELTFHLNELRSIKNLVGDSYHSKDVPAVAIHTYWKRFQPPTLATDKFDKIIEFDFEPIFTTKKEKKNFSIWF